MAKKLPGLSRVLGPRPLASVAYGEIASSLYFALGVVAYYALGFTPWVLLAAGIVFMLVALSYAEGTAAIPETGGAATLVRRAFNDPLGFMTGWALFLDYLDRDRAGGAFRPALLRGRGRVGRASSDEPWDVVVGACRHRGGRRRSPRPPYELVPARDCPGRDRARRPTAADRPGLRLPRQLGARSGKASTLGRRRPGAPSASRSRWRCSRTPASRPSPTSPPRPASRGRTSRAASSAGSAPLWSSPSP